MQKLVRILPGHALFPAGYVAVADPEKGRTPVVLFHPSAAQAMLDFLADPDRLELLDEREAAKELDVRVENGPS